MKLSKCCKFVSPSGCKYDVCAVKAKWSLVVSYPGLGTALFRCRQTGQERKRPMAYLNPSRQVVDAVRKLPANLRPQLR